MAKVYYSRPLAREYERLFDTCEILSEHFHEVDHVVKGISDNKNRKADQNLAVPLLPGKKAPLMR